ncbi:AmmeMemoRadiSam system radical SAM enzyme [Thiorhodovibrio frisius]|uniref:Pyruvate-formate lyase-activating enzyme n=1 Tax=Thiorhodovibrio frisius TaxID=631362 RepID=H8Z6G2_9GAMM|nr:AmmeMemoRadiSam system radical SAM enzyme [Thiorhodovibrio frisius]EIC19660.1 pyruvate-formate lyase-activating enzyme [Thiorhodovibrio frisius]WPL20372.1 molybdenum cofactor biosynthesis protein A [Thiorhodovibrio frisius]
MTLKVTTDTAARHQGFSHLLADGRIQCDLCPRACRLREGQRGLCFVRGASQGRMELLTYGRSSGFCIDPIEKKPLNHFLPGTPVLSFGTAGCNLTCDYCQNWDISKSRAADTLAATASPEQIAQAAHSHGCRSVAYTYNDPVIFLEYACDTAQECHALGVNNVAVTAGYISPGAREVFFADMDAANIDLKAFSEDFYRQHCSGQLGPVLETLEYLKQETTTWVEITTLLIPGVNDSDAELAALCAWISDDLGTEVPLHFSAFHPDFKLRHLPPTPPATLTRARHIARAHGLHHVYTGNVHDRDGASTWCHACGTLLIERDWYQLGAWKLSASGTCTQCGIPCAGVFEPKPGDWGARRQPIRW